MAPASIYSLNSTKTAVAIILPSRVPADVNAIRSVHDKAFHKWPPHINLLYPSVPAEQLKTALPMLQDAIKASSTQALTIKTDRIGTFKHRRNATIFLQPDEQTEDALSQLRCTLVRALGLSDRAGTLDRAFRPHLSLGQASLSSGAIDSLTSKCSKLTGLEWLVGELAVLSRKPSGEMEIIDRITLGPTPEAGEEPSELESGGKEIAEPVWVPCFAFGSDNAWRTYSGPLTDEVSEERPISVLSYNLLADTFGCSFKNRLPFIIDAIQSAAQADVVEVVCVQEVSINMIVEILNHPYIQGKYPFSSHCADSLLVNHLNLVTLSTRPFAVHSHLFVERHKSALVIQPCLLPFEIANIHLTAALKDHTVAAKRRQVASFTAFLHRDSRNPRRYPVVAGDFNMATSAITIDGALRKGDITLHTSITARTLVDPDIWKDAFIMSCRDEEADDEAGATFDVQKNPLASESNAPVDQRPQRYDRILFGKDAAIGVRNFRLFGLPNGTGQCGSDHFGIAAVLYPILDEHTSASSIDLDLIKCVPVANEDTNLEVLLGPSLPSSKDREQRVMSIAKLKKILVSDPRLSDLLLVPLGSYALDTFFAESDVDMLAIGSLPPSSFFHIASSRLSTATDEFRGLHYINSLVPVIEVELLGIKFDLQYCQAPELVTAAHPAKEASMHDLLRSGYVLSKLQPSALRPLNTYRDTAYLLDTIPCLEAFRSAHRYLALYLRRRGLYSARFGYLGGVHLSLLLNHVIKRLNSQDAASATASSLVRTFLHYYARFSWESEIVCDPVFQHPDYRRTSREPITILAMHSPTARPNVASSCTKLSARSLALEFAIAEEKLAAGEWDWMLREKNLVFQDFVNRFQAFIVATIDMWGLHQVSDAAQRAVVGYAESRVPMLMVQLGRIEEVYAQAWPFRMNSAQDEVEKGKQLKARYVIGICAPNEATAETRKAVQSKVLQVARAYETMIQGSEIFDADHMWVQAELQSRKSLERMELSCT